MKKICNLYSGLFCYTRFHLQTIYEKDGLTIEMGKNVSELLHVIDTELELWNMGTRRCFVFIIPSPPVST